MARVRCPIMGSHFPKIRRIIAPANGPVIYSSLYNLQTTVCERPHGSATSRVSTTNKGEDHDKSQSVSHAQFCVDRRNWRRPCPKPKPGDLSDQRPRP